jgi:hypothetical protein
VMLTEEQMRAIDETPSRRLGGPLYCLGFAAEARSRLPQKRPAWRIAADRRARQLELLGYLIQKEERGKS